MGFRACSFKEGTVTGTGTPSPTTPVNLSLCFPSPPPSPIHPSSPIAQQLPVTHSGPLSTLVLAFVQSCERFRREVFSGLFSLLPAPSWYGFIEGKASILYIESRMA